MEKRNSQPEQPMEQTRGCVSSSLCHELYLLYNKTIVVLCFGRHGVLLNSKLNHIDLGSASVNMKFTVQ